jgi:hypothetical protein
VNHGVVTHALPLPDSDRPGHCLVVAAMDEGIPAREILYQKPPNCVIAPVPDEYREYRDQHRRSYGKETPTVFVSRRHPTGDRRRVTDCIKKVIGTFRWQVLEGDVPHGDPVYTHVMKKLWTCDAGIVLVSKGAEGDSTLDEGFSANLAHELGFIQGQGKPVLLLVQNQCRRDEISRKFTNIQGVVVQTFSDDVVSATHPDNPESVPNAVQRWLLELQGRW